MSVILPSMFLAPCRHVVYIARQVDWKHLHSRAQFIRQLVGKRAAKELFARARLRCFALAEKPAARGLCSLWQLETGAC